MVQDGVRKAGAKLRGGEGTVDFFSPQEKHSVNVAMITVIQLLSESFGKSIRIDTKNNTRVVLLMENFLYLLQVSISV